MKDGIELKRFWREAKMTQTRPYLIFAAVVPEPPAESTNKKLKKTKNKRELTLKSKLKKMQDGRLKKRMNS